MLQQPDLCVRPLQLGQLGFNNVSKIHKNSASVPINGQLIVCEQTDCLSRKAPTTPQRSCLDFEVQASHVLDAALMAARLRAS